jgi:hypothetical protein
MLYHFLLIFHWVWRSFNSISHHYMLHHFLLIFPLGLKEF